MRAPLAPILLSALAAAFALAPAAKARPDDYKVNVRESCRQTVAGAHLKAYDERERTIAYVKALAEQHKATEKALVEVHARLAKAKLAAEQGAYDTERAVQLDQVSAEAHTLEAQRDDYARLEAESQGKVRALTVAAAELEAELKKVFVLRKTGDLKDGGYPIEVSYRSPCPKYRYVCPLPREDANTLDQLVIPGAELEDCHKYASLSRIH